MSGSPSVTAFAPGSVGNLICGFDVLGLALEGPGDRVTARLREEPGVGLRSVSGDGGRIPRDPERNTASVSVAALLERHESATGVALELDKGLPLSGGMGGSAASAVAAVLAADALLGLGSEPEELLECALAGERAAAGSAHPDNVGPSLRGGIVLVRREARRALVPLPVPDGLSVALLHPWIELRTSEARDLLPRSVSLEDAVGQWGDTAALVAGLFRDDWDLMSDALQDRIAEPTRSGRIPGFTAMREAATEAGAVGFGVSGAGPSVVALCRGLEAARRTGERLAETFSEHSTARSDLHVGRVPTQGARVVERTGMEVA